LGFVSVDAMATLESVASSEASPETRAELARLDEVLTQLGHEERMAWILRYVEGFKLEEVAELSKCSLTTVKRRIGRADARVRAHVALDEVNDG